MMKIVSNELFFAWVEEELAKGNNVRIRMKGVSMLPLLRGEKDEVLLAPCPPDELKPMDVVLFHFRGKHVLHRIIRRKGDWLRIQGDGSFVAVEQCHTKDVVGKVIKVYRPSGREVSVDSWRWRWPSRLWRCSDTLRRLMLRVIHLFRAKKREEL